MIIRLKSGVDSDFLLHEKEYVVFAIYISTSIELMVLGENSFPLSVSSDDVDVIDERLSKHWVYGSSDGGNWSAILSFPEWANDPSYYQNLVEGKGNAGSVFRSYIDQIQNEYAGSGIEKVAIFLKDNWYQCPLCDDAWEYESNNEVMVCPSCKKKVRKPKP